MPEAQVGSGSAQGGNASSPPSIQAPYNAPAMPSAEASIEGKKAEARKEDAKKAQATSPQPPLTKDQHESAAVNQSEAAMRRHKLRIDGKELDLAEPEVLAYATKGAAADKRFQEAAELRKDAEQFLTLLKTDFTKLLDDPRLGFDEKQKRELLEEYYRRKYIDPETLSPEQLKQRQTEFELGQYKEREKQAETQRQRQQEAELEKFHAEQFQKKFIAALETQQLPKTPYTIKRMAELEIKQQQLGFELPPEQLASLVRQDIATELKGIAGAAKGDELITLLGEEVVNEIRKADLARLRSQQPGQPKPVVETAVSAQPRSQAKVQSFDEMRAERDQKAADLQKSWKK